MVVVEARGLDQDISFLRHLRGITIAVARRLLVTNVWLIGFLRVLLPSLCISRSCHLVWRAEDIGESIFLSQFMSIIFTQTRPNQIESNGRSCLLGFGGVQEHPSDGWIGVVPASPYEKKEVGPKTSSAGKPSLQRKKLQLQFTST